MDYLKFFLELLTLGVFAAAVVVGTLMLIDRLAKRQGWRGKV